MKRNCLILTVLITVCVLLLQLGCQEQARMVEESKPALTMAKPAIGPAKTEAVPETTEPALQVPHLAKEAQKRNPEIMFEQVSHDFGEVGMGVRKGCEFKFTNTGDDVLKITKIRRTCNCVSHTLEKEEYAPGESGTLKVEYHTGRHPGTANYRLFVFSNDEKKPKVTLTVSAKVVSKVRHKPERLNFSLNEENAGCPEITLTSLDNQPFAISSFKSTADCITVDYDPSVEKTEFVLVPRVDIEKLQKVLKGRVTIGLTHPGCDTVTILLDVLPRFTINPPVIIAIDAEPQKPITKELWILNNYGEDFEVASALSEKNIIEVLSQEKIGNRYKFELEITPPAVKSETRIFTDVFFVNIKDGEQLKIRCRGFYSGK